MADWHYDSADFIVCCGVTEGAAFLALIMLFINMRKHYYAEYSAESKVAMFISFVTLGVILVLIMIASPVYKGASAFLIVINILNSLFILSFYLLVSEKLTFYLWKFCTEYPAMKRRIVQERIPCQKMFKHQYPMSEYGLIQKTLLRDYFVKYCYLLEGRGRILYFFFLKIKTYAEAYSFQRENTLVILIYIITVPIAMTAEYIMEETDAIVIRDFNLKSVFRVYILVFTFLASLCMMSYSRSFNRIVPFNKFETILSTLTIIKTFFDFSGSAIRIAAWDMDPINEFDAYNLIFLATFAVFLLLITIVHYYVIDPKDFVFNFQKQMVVDFTWYDSDHQLSNLVSKHKGERNSAPCTSATFRKIEDGSEPYSFPDEEEDDTQRMLNDKNYETFPLNRQEENKEQITREVDT
ncbi:unnamed protein product [Moneuplotes crassus]|uniref:Uncharacterized protein n=1 Tax=Euplotes crassus TaxID=5936 RepID=A0AAD1U2T7_EUPCR|nr:unnamed protein product [Moneuplotes crassus]